MEEKVEQGPSIGVLLGILAALIVGVILIFAMLEIAVPDYDIPMESTQVESTIEERPAPKFCTNCGDELPGSFQWNKFCPFCGRQVKWEEPNG